MKRLFLPLLFFMGCSDSGKKNESKTDENFYLLNGEIKCKIFQTEQFYTRVATSEQVSKVDLKKVADSLNIKTGIVYFHIPELLSRGEEYGSISSGQTYIFDDFDREQFLFKKAEREKENLEKIERQGVRDEEFAQKAFIVSKDFVKAALKSPKSAKFPSSDYKFSNVLNNTIIIQSYVDAKNEFNTVVRNNYTIKMQLTGNEWELADNWKIISFDFH